MLLTSPKKRKEVLFVRNIVFTAFALADARRTVVTSKRYMIHKLFVEDNQYGSQRSEVEVTTTTKGTPEVVIIAKAKDVAAMEVPTTMDEVDINRIIKDMCLATTTMG